MSKILYEYTHTHLGPYLNKPENFDLTGRYVGSTI